MQRLSPPLLIFKTPESVWGHLVGVFFVIFKSRMLFKKAWTVVLYTLLRAQLRLHQWEKLVNKNIGHCVYLRYKVYNGLLRSLWHENCKNLKNTSWPWHELSHQTCTLNENTMGFLEPINNIGLQNQRKGITRWFPSIFTKYSFPLHRVFFVYFTQFKPGCLVRLPSNEECWLDHSFPQHYRYPENRPHLIKWYAQYRASQKNDQLCIWNCARNKNHVTGDSWWQMPVHSAGAGAILTYMALLWFLVSVFPIKSVLHVTRCSCEFAP